MSARIAFALAGVLALLCAASQKSSAPAFPDLTAFPMPYELRSYLEPSFDAADAKSAVDQLTVVRTERVEQWKSAGHAIEPGDGSPVLRGTLDVKHAIQFAIVPRALAAFQPLWKDFKWNSRQLDTARRIARNLEVVEGAPALQFSDINAEANHQAIDELGKWFVERCAKPEYYAAALCRLSSEGPFEGVKWEGTEALKPIETKKLEHEIELRLGKCSRKGEQWVLQAVHGKELLWSVVLCDAPAPPITYVHFNKDPAEKLGAWGSSVAFDINSSKDGQSLEALIGAKGEFLFYFVYTPSNVIHSSRKY